MVSHRLQANFGPILAFDTASPVVSVAVATRGRVLSVRTLELRRSSEKLLRTIEETLTEADCALKDLGGIVALQGPGSFTGLRIGLGTALGLHQALAIPATAWPTLPILAAAAAPEIEDTRRQNHSQENSLEVSTAQPTQRQTLLAAVDSIRGEWSVQSFRLQAVASSHVYRAVELSAPQLLGAAAILDYAPAHVVGFGVTALAQQADWSAKRLTTQEPPPLAPIAARLASVIHHEQDGTNKREANEWDATRLTAPLYARPPAVTAPKT